MQGIDLTNIFKSLQVYLGFLLIIIYQTHGIVACKKGYIDIIWYKIKIQ